MRGHWPPTKELCALIQNEWMHARPPGIASSLLPDKTHPRAQCSSSQLRHGQYICSTVTHSKTVYTVRKLLSLHVLPISVQPMASVTQGTNTTLQSLKEHSSAMCNGLTPPPHCTSPTVLLLHPTARLCAAVHVRNRDLLKSKKLEINTDVTLSKTFEHALAKWHSLTETLQRNKAQSCHKNKQAKIKIYKYALDSWCTSTGYKRAPH